MKGGWGQWWQGAGNEGFKSLLTWDEKAVYLIWWYITGTLYFKSYVIKI